jgi:NADPH:quinone reductase-like Zn-dependent oxidoreductase
MQAATIHHLGPDAIVQFEPIAPPVPAVDEVVVCIEAAGVNPLDIKIMAGYMAQVIPVELPYIPGTDYSGVVTATGPLVTAVKAGDRVVGRSNPATGGAFAHTILARADALVVIPDEMSFEQAAALPTAFGTARQALFDVGHLKAGQRVLIHAGAGGVGSFAIQLARQAGAHVSATASAGNLGILKELGANEAIDYRADDFTRLQEFDVMLDTIGGDTTERSWGVLREGGTLATLIDFAIAPRDGRHGAFVFFAQATEALREAVALFRAGKLDIIIDSLYPFERASAALGKVASGHARGKVVIRTAR